LCLLGVAALVLAGTTGCSAREIFFIGLPEPITEQGKITQSLWEGAWVAAWPVGFLVWGLLIAAIIAYTRRNRPDMPEQTAYHLPLEILYTVAPLVMIFGLFWFTARDQTDLRRVTDDQTHTVNVIGFRWSWAFNYTDEDVYEIGTPQQFATLYLPVDEKVRFELSSPDVVHSFWVPDFLFKMDVIPGKLNQFEVTPNQIGEYAGKCAELCGVDHSHMLFNVKVVSRAEYDAHIAELKARGQTGQLQTGRVNRSGEYGPEGKAS
jgi:cytochrome c oxidase subunit II